MHVNTERRSTQAWGEGSGSPTADSAAGKHFCLCPPGPHGEGAEGSHSDCLILEGNRGLSWLLEVQLKKKKKVAQTY